MKNVLSSNHFRGAIATIIVVILIELVPPLEPLRDNLMEIVLTIVGFVLGHAGVQIGWALVGVGQKWK